MTEADKRRLLFLGREPWFVLGLVALAIHLVFNAGYGIFRDELYFIVCGQRPAWGYMDQPPLIPLLVSWSHAVFGNFLVGFRLVPALALSATVALSAVFVRSLGGGRFAQWLAGLCWWTPLGRVQLRHVVHSCEIGCVDCPPFDP